MTRHRLRGSSTQRTLAGIAIGAVLLLALWFVASLAPRRGEVPAAPSGAGEASVRPLEEVALAEAVESQVETVRVAPSVEHAAADGAHDDAVSASEADDSIDESTPNEQVPDLPGSKEAYLPSAGETAQFVLSVLSPDYVFGPRLPAWLELEARWRKGDERETRRVLGTIEGDTWVFEVVGLEPDLARWTVELGHVGAFAGRTALRVGRTEVFVPLAELPAARLVVHADFGFEDVESRGGVEVVFGSAVPWIALADGAGATIAFVPMREYVDASVGRSEGAWSADVPVFAAQHAARAELVGGASRRETVTIENSGDGRFEVEFARAGASDSASESANALNFDLRIECDEDDVPAEAQLVLYGNVPRTLGPDARLWQSVPLSFRAGEGGEFVASVDLAADRVLRPARAMLIAPGRRPVFFDPDEALAATSTDALARKTLRVELLPGSGGVVIGGYQNHRGHDEHFAPAWGFDVRRKPAIDAELELPDWTRLGPMGYAEFASDLVEPFRAAAYECARPQPNRDRTSRPIYPNLAIELRDASGGVIELIVRD